MFRSVILFSLLAAITTMFGAFLVHYNRKRVKGYLIHIIGASAGVLLGASFIHLLPEAMELNTYALSYTLVAFLLFYLLEQLVIIHPCAEPNCDTHKLKLGRISFVAFAVHSLLDGMAITVGFSVDPTLGVIAAVAVILHELPEGIATLTLLHYAEYPHRRSLLLTSVVAIATPIGAILTYFIIPWITFEIQGALLGLIAGSFLYVAAADLIPETHRAGNRKTFLFMLMGLGFLILVTSFLGH
jgi:zinc and cadmium transporter